MVVKGEWIVVVVVPVVVVVCAEEINETELALEEDTETELAVEAVTERGGSSGHCGITGGF